MARLVLKYLVHEGFADARHLPDDSFARQVYELLKRRQLAGELNLPISGLKIDKSFVLNMHKHDVAVIVRSVVELGHNLGLSVVAEGVETAAAAIALSGGFIQARPKNRAPLHGAEKLCARPQVA